VARGLIEGTPDDAMRRYRDAIDAGLLKIMSKMGISVISSYRGGLNFEAVGLSRAMVAEYFPGMQSRISGIGAGRHPEEAEEVHARGWRGDVGMLPVGGFYKARRSGEKHAWEATTMHLLQSACDRASYDMWKQVFGRAALQPADPYPRPAGHQAAGPADPDRGGGKHHRDPQALRHAGHVAGRAVARGAQDAQHRHEPHRREIRFRRGRRGSGAFPPELPMATTPRPRSSRWPRAASA
jgi:glutamate synthase domain-containing protein 2